MSKVTTTTMTQSKLNSHNECSACSGFHLYCDDSICGEEIFDPTDLKHSLKCTRKAGHSGNHVACAPGIGLAYAHNLTSSSVTA